MLLIIKLKDKTTIEKQVDTTLPKEELANTLSKCLYSGEGLFLEELNGPVTWFEVDSIKVYDDKSFHPTIRRASFDRSKLVRALEMLGNACAVCGTEEDLEFDHILPESKSFNIKSNMSLSWYKLEPELRKCQLLCKKHHIEKSIKETPPASHGTIYMYREYGCRCEPCREAKRRNQ